MTDLIDLDERLKDLALEAQNHPPNSDKRRQALSDLIQLIIKSRSICRPYRFAFKGIYEEIHAEAQQLLFLYICENIQKYDPTFRVLQWVNFLFKKRFFVKASREIWYALPTGLNSKKIRRIDLDELENYGVPDEMTQSAPLLSQEILQFIQEDPDKIFQKSYIGDNPKASFQFIVIQRLNGYSWEEISQELDIPTSTLSGFYKRCLKRFCKSFRQYFF